MQDFLLLFLIVTGATVLSEKHKGFVLLICIISAEGEFQKIELFNSLSKCPI